MKKTTFNLHKNDVEFEPKLTVFYENPLGKQFSVIQIGKNEFLVVLPDYLNVKKRSTKASALRLVEKLMNKLNAEIVNEKKSQISALKNDCKVLSERNISRFISKNPPTTEDIFFQLWLQRHIRLEKHKGFVKYGSNT